MFIPKDKYEKIIEHLKVGNSVAEIDSLLDAARVETPVFDGVLNDKYDIILGRKGAGKTAIFRIVNMLDVYLLKEKNIVILSGVNSSGESLFNEYKENFATFSEQDFENFWKFYFISLINNEFLKNPKYQGGISRCPGEIENFIRECEKAGIPNIQARQERNQIVKWLVGLFGRKVKKIKVGVDVGQADRLFSVTPEIEFDNTPDVPVETKESVYINQIAKALKTVLQKSGFKVWIILDRLDEVFDRYSGVEFNGLRGLLKAYKSFDVDPESDLFRIKLFLRDDIVEFLTDSGVYKKYFRKKEIPPLPAATHIFAKKSPTLNWSEDEIEQLILNRLLLNPDLKTHVGITENIEVTALRELLRMKNNREKYWNNIFPPTISSSRSLKWIFTRLKDSNDVVTPRSVIDMLEAAITYQRKKMLVDYGDCEHIFPVDAIKEGLLVASKNKLENDIYNEFPREQENIKKLGKEGKIKLTQDDLKKLYGEKWEEVASSLNRIGVIRFVKDSGTYRVEQLFRPALNLDYKF